jgi:hypothetical protein
VKEAAMCGLQQYLWHLIIVQFCVNACGFGGVCIARLVLEVIPVTSIHDESMCAQTHSPHKSKSEHV